MCLVSEAGLQADFNEAIFGRSQRATRVFDSALAQIVRHGAMQIKPKSTGQVNRMDSYHFGDGSQCMRLGITIIQQLASPAEPCRWDSVIVQSGATKLRTKFKA